VTSDASVDAFAAALSNVTVDVLVNNAGWLAAEYPMSLAEQTLEDAAMSFEVNTLGPLRVLRALRSTLAADAKVINISSRYSSLENTSAVDCPGYCMSKAALNMLSRQFAFDAEMDGKTIVSVSPGWVRTRMGGPEAHLSVEESAFGIASVVETITPSDSGLFIHYDGSRIPW
jgi:NAD(P)-dependent dehydrogenase (short-subunit alcohol dehydrogenase family)